MFKKYDMDNTKTISFDEFKPGWDAFLEDERSGRVSKLNAT